PPYTAQCAERLGVPGGRAPVITSPKAGAVIYSPAGFDAARVLLAAGADPDAAILYWYADGAFLGARRVGKALEWSAPAGTHELAVVDDLGRTSTMRLTIRRR
ncbi:MAG: penicillin-binding protein 1C, partial [Sutterella sp.]|nr:penicillin-binding protein 1C [Sutterella sp.]